MKGVDLSAYQGVLPWQKLNDIQFGIIKVTEGEGYINPYWYENTVEMRKHGKLCGFYMFTTPGLGKNTPEGDARYFWTRVGRTVQKGDLIAVDLETTLLNPQQTSQWAFKVLSTLESLASWKPLIYSYPDFIRNNLTDKRLAAYPLWLAWYDDNLPRSFEQWPVIALWQRGPGTVQGETEDIDIDIFFLKADRLRAYGKP